MVWPACAAIATIEVIRDAIATTEMTVLMRMLI
jgi:hypothetical protein